MWSFLMKQPLTPTVLGSDFIKSVSSYCVLLPMSPSHNLISWWHLFHYWWVCGWTPKTRWYRLISTCPLKTDYCFKQTPAKLWPSRLPDVPSEGMPNQLQTASGDERYCLASCTSDGLHGCTFWTCTSKQLKGKENQQANHSHPTVIKL